MIEEGRQDPSSHPTSQQSCWSTDYESFEDLGGPCRSMLILAVSPGQTRFGASVLLGPCQSFPILVSNQRPERVLEGRYRPLRRPSSQPATQAPNRRAADSPSGARTLSRPPDPGRRHRGALAWARGDSYQATRIIPMFMKLRDRRPHSPPAPASPRPTAPASWAGAATTTAGSASSATSAWP